MRVCSSSEGRDNPNKQGMSRNLREGGARKKDEQDSESERERELGEAISCGPRNPAIQHGPGVRIRGARSLKTRTSLEKRGLLHELIKNRSTGRLITTAMLSSQQPKQQQQQQQRQRILVHTLLVAVQAVYSSCCGLATVCQ